MKKNELKSAYTAPRSVEIDTISANVLCVSYGNDGCPGQEVEDTDYGTF